MVDVPKAAQIARPVRTGEPVVHDVLQDVVVDAVVEERPVEPQPAPAPARAHIDFQAFLRIQPGVADVEPARPRPQNEVPFGRIGRPCAPSEPDEQVERRQRRVDEPAVGADVRLEFVDVLVCAGALVPRPAAHPVTGSVAAAGSGAGRDRSMPGMRVAHRLPVSVAARPMPAVAASRHRHVMAAAPRGAAVVVIAVL